MKTAIVYLLKKLVAMLVTKKMIFWALELAAKQTDNKIDDNVIRLIKAAYDGDDAGFRAAVEGIIGALKNKEPAQAVKLHAGGNGRKRPPE